MVRRFTCTAIVVAGLSILVALGGGVITAAHASLKHGGESALSLRRVTSHVQPTGTKYVMTISADIDGLSTLHIVGHRAWWTHAKEAAPGLHNGSRLPTRIGRWSWFPGWPAAGENRDCGCKSSVFEGVYPALPRSGSAITFAKVNCREKCTGTAANGQATIVFDDVQEMGDAQYTVRLTYYLKAATSAKLLFKDFAIRPSSLVLKSGGELKLCDGNRTEQDIYVIGGDLPKSSAEQTYTVRSLGCRSLRLDVKSGKTTFYSVGSYSNGKDTPLAEVTVVP
jgi:hypothetical protein